MPKAQKSGNSFVLWAKRYLTFFAVWYYSAYFFIGLFLVFLVRAIHPLNIELLVLNIFTIALLAELAFWRYRRLKPQKSYQFSIGASEVIDLVHNEGILRYRRNGKYYALYSNIMAPTKKDS